MKRVVVIGAGGHGREVAEILREQRRHDPAVALLGFVDENEALHGQRLDGTPVLGGWRWFEENDTADVAVICAVGQPALRRKLLQRVDALGLAYVSAVSPAAHVSPGAYIGRGVTLFPHVFVSTKAHLADHCILNVGVSVSHDARVGRYTNVNPGVRLAGHVVVGEGCYLGMGTNVIQGRQIGSWSVLGAGAVVVRDVPANATAVGVPARVIKTRPEGWHEEG